jgi:cytochrome c556
MELIMTLLNVTSIPRRPVVRMAALLAGALAAASMLGVSAAQSPKPTTTIKEFMETTITDASNALWNAFDPPTSDEQWTALDKAAQQMLDASKTLALGGTGPKDNEWVKQAAWQPFNDAMLAASEKALAAIRARDHDALLAAGDDLYPPCEGCHLVFNPGVVEQN